MCKRAGALARNLFAMLGVLVTVIFATPLVDWYGNRLAGRWEDPPGDILIVLGGGATGDMLLGLDSYWRAAYAVQAYRQGPFKKILICGGVISPAIRGFMVGSGVPAAVVETEDRSTSTRENALYAAEILRGEPGRKVLLTSDFHMFRAHRAFRKAGLEVLPRPLGDARKRAARWYGRWPAFLDEVVETVKIGYYFARGWI